VEDADDRGFNIDAYHGTTAAFDAFDPRRTGDIGMHFGTLQQADKVIRPIFRSPDNAEYQPGANIIPVKLRLHNPLRVYDMFSTLRTTYMNRAKIWCLNTKGFDPNNEDHDRIFDLAKQTDRLRRAAGGEWGALNKSKSEQQAKFTASAADFWRAIQASAERQGYDGLVYGNRVEGKGDSYVVFHPNNIRTRHASFDPSKTSSDKLLDGRVNSHTDILGETLRHGHNGVPETLYHGTGLQQYLDMRASNTFDIDSYDQGNLGFSTTEDESVAIRFARMSSQGGRWGVVLTLDGHKLAASHTVTPHDDDDEYGTLGDNYEWEWVVTSKTNKITNAKSFITQVQVVDTKGDPNYLQPWDETVHGDRAVAGVPGTEAAGIAKLKATYSRPKAQAAMLALARIHHPNEPSQKLRDLIADLNADQLYKMLWLYHSRKQD